MRRGGNGGDGGVKIKRERERLGGKRKRGGETVEGEKGWGR